MEPDRTPVSLPEAWRLLRRQLENLHRRLAFPVETGSLGIKIRAPASLEDVEALVRDADATVRDLEARQSALDQEWRRVLAERSRLAGGLSRLREEAYEARAPFPPPPGIDEQAAMLELLCVDIARQESSVLREKLALNAAWSRLLRDAPHRLAEALGDAFIGRMETLTRLPPEIHRLAAEAKQAHQALLESRKEIARLERLRRGTEARLAARESEIDQLQARFVETERKESEWEHASQDARAGQAKTEAELDEARRVHEDLRRRLAAAEEAANGLRQEAAGLSSALQQARAETGGLKAAGESLREEIFRSTAALSQIRGERDALRGSLDSAEASHRERTRPLEESLQAARQEIARLTEALSLAQEGYAPLRESLLSMDERHRQTLRSIEEEFRQTLRSAEQESGRKFETARAALEAARKEIANLAESLSRMRSERDGLAVTLESSQADQRRRVDLLEQSLGAAKQEALHLAATLERARDERAALLENLRSAEEARRLEARTAEIEQRRKLRAAESALDAAQEDAARSTAELARTQEERDGLRQNLASAQQEIARLNEALARGQEGHEALREKLRSSEAGRFADLQTAEDELRGKLQSAQTALEAAREDTARSAAQLARMQAERDALRQNLDSAQAGYRDRLQITEQSLEAARQEISRMSEALAAAQKKEESVPSFETAAIEALKEALASRETARAEETVPPAPTLEAALDPGWIKVVELLRQPLASALAHLRLLAGAAAPGHRAAVGLAAGFVAQAQDLVATLGEYLEEPTAPPAPGRLQTALESALAVWEPTFQRAQISIVRKFDPESGPIPIRPASLRVALYQILRNAYEAMASGGCLTVRCWRDAEAGQACLSFADSGPGFSKTAMDRLFEPLGVAKAGHAGIGLALTRRIARRMGGEAAAANGKEGGAIVTLRLPVHASPLRVS